MSEPSFDLADLASLNDRLRASLPDYLPAQRWFGDKARQIRSATVIASFPIGDFALPASMLIIEVAFDAGDPSRYLLPVMATEPAAEKMSIVRDDDGFDGGNLVEALDHPLFHNWLVGLVVRGSDVSSGNVTLTVDAAPQAGRLLELASNGPSQVLGVEQSNSAIVFGQSAFMKLFRKVPPGVNPDVEVARFLTTKGTYANTPGYLGSLHLRTDNEPAAAIAIVQHHVASQGDGWSHITGLLRSPTSVTGFGDLLEESRNQMARLGIVTANMHLALASDPWNADFTPEPIETLDIEHWTASYQQMLQSVVASLPGAMPALSPDVRELAQAFITVAGGLRRRSEGFDRLLGKWKTRVHGDYHLGQTLKTFDDFMVIDFEGEPQRTIAERRMKTSPLKDVAGMLRSFAYARGMAAASFATGSRLGPSDLAHWESDVRRAFLTAYRDTVVSVEPRLIPSGQPDFEAAVAAWELDKALYEVQYELNNRPDWLWIPLSAMLKFGEPT